MSKFSTLFCVAALAAFATTAFADDPVLQQNGTSACPPTSPAQPWCSSEQQGTDSATGLTTVEYVFNLTNIPATNESDWSGWVLGTINGTAAELLHFVNLGTLNAPQNAVFLYCGGNPADICSSNNAGLPSYEEYSGMPTFNMGSTPLGNPSLLYNPTATGPGNETYGGYSIGFSNSPADNELGSVITPEPSGALLLGAMLVGVAGFARRRFFGHA